MKEPAQRDMSQTIWGNLADNKFEWIGGRFIERAPYAPGALPDGIIKDLRLVESYDEGNGSYSYHFVLDGDPDLEEHPHPGFSVDVDSAGFSPGRGPDAPLVIAMLFAGGPKFEISKPQNSSVWLSRFRGRWNRFVRRVRRPAQR